LTSNHQLDFAKTNL